MLARVRQVDGKGTRRAKRGSVESSNRLSFWGLKSNVKFIAGLKIWEGNVCF